MFDHPSVMRFSGPLAVHAPGLWATLLQQGYKDRSANELLRVAAHLSRWLKATRLQARDLTEDRLGEFVALRDPPPRLHAARRPSGTRT